MAAKRQLGNSGIHLAPFALGGNVFGWTADERASFEVLDAFLAAGFNFIDTADAYSAWVPGHKGGESEEVIGKWVKARGNRDKVIIATKLAVEIVPGESGLSRAYMQKAVERSLKRLQTDYIDLYQLHGFDALTPIEETLTTLDDLVREGKIRYIGCSNFSGWQLMKSLAISDRRGLARYVAHQAYYSLIGRDYEWELMPLALDQSVGTVVWSPLGWGRLSGKMRRGQPLLGTTRLQSKLALDKGPPVSTEHIYRVVDALDEAAKETGKTVAQVALNWLLQRPSISSVIIGARNEEQLKQNLGAVGWNLNAEQIARLDTASATIPAYPYWHQRGFVERNPSPVAW
jgi:aryl-alcohol dehydrogenase-like predicted oxidoreductase